MGRFSTNPEVNKPTPNDTRQQMQQQGPWPTVFNNKPIAIEFEGVVTEPRGGMITSLQDVKFNMDNIEGIRQLRLKQHPLMLMAAYPQINRGVMNQSQADQIHQQTMQVFGQAGIQSIDGLLIAMSDLKEDEFAIPNTGMLSKAKNENRIDFSKGYYVGDNIKVLKAAEKYGATPVLIKSSRHDETMTKLNTFANKKLLNKTKMFNSLQEFASSL